LVKKNKRKREEKERNETKVGIEVKWRRNRKEIRRWIKMRKSVRLRIEEGRGVVRRSGRGCTRERRWRMEPSLQRRREGSTLPYINPVPGFPAFF